MNLEQLPYMPDEWFNTIAFVYRNKTEGIRVVGMTMAKEYQDKTQWDHIATLDSHKWIECLLRNNSRERNKQISAILNEPTKRNRRTNKAGKQPV
jgi:hypothetical protein